MTNSPSLLDGMYRAVEDEAMDVALHQQILEERLASGNLESVRRILEACQMLSQLPQITRTDRAHDR